MASLNGGGQARGDQFHRAERRRRLGHEASHLFGHRFVAGEEHFTLVGEVPEERPGREPCPRRDLRDGGLGEALIEEEIERGLLESFSRTRRPSTHALNSSDDTTCHVGRRRA
jgi:hypothetical protein